MASGTISYTPVGQDPSGPGLFKLIGEKVKKAKEQAVEARQEADKRIGQLKEKITEDDYEDSDEGRQEKQQDIEEWQSLEQKRGKNAYFFKKALKFQATDKIRTTIGKFQRDPELQNDPAATEKERFYAKTGMFRPGEMPDMSDREGSKDVVSYVGKGFQLIMDAIDKIKARVNKTASSSEQTASTASSTESKTDGVKNSTENLNKTTETISNVSKQEVNVQKSELEFEQQAEQDRNRAEAEARSEMQSDTSSVTDVAETDQGGNNKGGLFSSIFNIGRELIGGRGGGRLGGFSRRGRAFGRLGRMRAGRMMNPARRNRQYTSPIGPQPMNSPTPWAAEGGGFVPRMPSSNINLSDGGIIAPLSNNVQRQKKLADGGIIGLISNLLLPSLGGNSSNSTKKSFGNGFQMLTNPTKLIGDGLRAVLPMNRTVGKSVFGGSDKKKIEDMTKGFQLPTIVGGGIMFASIAEIAKAVPFLGAIISAARPIIKPIIEAFGLPPSILGKIFGGAPAAAGQMGDGGTQPEEDPPPPPTPPGQTPPGAPLPGGSANFASVTGTSGSVAINGREETPVAVDYSPIAKSDVQKGGITITSTFGYRRRFGRDHKGYDIAGPEGTPLYAYLGGEVTKVGLERDGDGYGNSIEWKDNVHGVKHFFGHMQFPTPYKKGDKIKQGDRLGLMGSTGRSTGPHLHWEIRAGAGGAAVDPGVWIRAHPLVRENTRGDVTGRYARPQDQVRFDTSNASITTPRSNSRLPAASLASAAAVIQNPTRQASPRATQSTDPETTFGIQPPGIMSNIYQTA